MIYEETKVIMVGADGEKYEVSYDDRYHVVQLKNISNPGQDPIFVTHDDLFIAVTQARNLKEDGEVIYGTGTSKQQENEQGEWCGPTAVTEAA